MTNYLRMLVLAAVFIVSPALADDPPTANWKSPPLDTTQVSGVVPLQVNVSDDGGIANVAFKDGSTAPATTLKLFAPNASGIYKFDWDTNLVSEGAHSIYAVVRDFNNNVTVTPPVNVTVKHNGLTIIRSLGFNGRTIGLRVQNAFGGAVHSLMLGGTQLMPPETDFGAQAQSTLYLNGLAWRCAVYETGTYGTRQTDGTFTPGIPSPVNYIIGGTDWLETDITTRYAYPTLTLTSAAGCGMEHEVYFSKRITMNAAGMANVIKNEMSYTTTSGYQRNVPLNHTHGTFMAWSVNMPLAEFPKQHYYDPSTATLHAIPDDRIKTHSVHICATETTCWPIMSNVAGDMALGLFVPGDVYDAAGGIPDAVTYSGNLWRDLVGESRSPINEFQCRYNYWPAMLAGTYSFRCYTIIGTVAQVMATIDQLYAMNNAGTLD